MVFIITLSPSEQRLSYAHKQLVDIQWQAEQKLYISLLLFDLNYHHVLSTVHIIMSLLVIFVEVACNHYQCQSSASVRAIKTNRSEQFNKFTRRKTLLASMHTYVTQTWLQLLRYSRLSAHAKRPKMASWFLLLCQSYSLPSWRCFGTINDDCPIVALQSASVATDRES